MREISFTRGMSMIAGIINITLGCFVAMGGELSTWYIVFTLVVLGVYQLFDRIKED